MKSCSEESVQQFFFAVACWLIHGLFKMCVHVPWTSQAVSVLIEAPLCNRPVACKFGFRGLRAHCLYTSFSLWHVNDFEYDESAAKWMHWGYLKTFLEGDKITVGIPKCRGGDKDFTSDAPVFMTAPQKVTFLRGRRIDMYETAQMDARIRYVALSHTFEEHVECKPCGHCGANFYLEGLTNSFPSSSSASPASATPSASSTSGQNSSIVAGAHTCT